MSRSSSVESYDTSESTTRFKDFSNLPDLPYKAGFEATITAHVPPAPFGDDEYDGPGRNNLAATNEQKSVTRVELVKAYIPRESDATSRQSTTPATQRLRILKVLAGGFHRGPQVVLCHIQPGQGRGGSSFRAVAKIYDPLYYKLGGFSLVHWHSTGLDVAYRADGDYSREAAAYERLRTTGPTLEGSFTPRYYGSWTLNISWPTEPATTGSSAPKHRAVRLILIEHIDGCTMRDLGLDPGKSSGTEPGGSNSDGGGWDVSRYQNYSQDYREAVMVKLLEGRAHLWHNGVNHRDWAARNLMLSPRPQKSTPLAKQPFKDFRVVQIDFDRAVVWDGGADKNAVPLQKECRREKLPWNPMEGSWHGVETDFVHWLPERLENRRSRREWLIENFGLKGKSEQYFALDEVPSPDWKEAWKSS